MLIIATE